MAQSRRDVLKQGASLAALSAAGLTVASSGAAAAAAAPAETVTTGPGGMPYPYLKWPEQVKESTNTPRLCQWFSRNPTQATVRRWRQAGVTGALITNPPPLPWTAATLIADRQRLEAAGLHITAYLISITDSIVRGQEGRDQQIEYIKQSLVAAGQAGIRVVEYNFYVHRLTEGYYELIDNEDRLGAGYTAFDYHREVDGVPVKDLPPRPGTPLLTYEQVWDNYKYFLDRVMPVAEAAGVRLAVHPNDPPAVISRGNPQVLASVADWKRLIDTYDSPANGLTVHAGVTPEVGHDAVDFLRYVGAKDRVNHIHYRNVTVDKPRERYAEVFPDTGETDMFAFMRELVRQGYDRGVLAEHPRALDFDRENGSIGGQYAGVGGGGHGGELYDTGYARAMLQAALIMERGRKPVLDDAETLVNRFYAAGAVKLSDRARLQANLKVADQLAEQSEAAIDRFAGVAQGIEDAEARTSLTSMAAYLKAQIPN
ncbi:mannonate dehydratase [Micromonospora cremea]|uniref:mannonate dehydratase n=1 Tax=Micromonospora cremea TaxID=709881 RepID=A0A1N5U576_9ACTN|nr:mannonate dehydratase [Micromonospora cremea]SIM55710.1 mannonate dehydratase [Micromonospora cremea]